MHGGFMKKTLPPQPSLEQLKKQAKDLLRSYKVQHPAALARIREHLPELRGKPDPEISSAKFALHDAQSVVAREYGFESWLRLKEEVEKQQEAARRSAVDQFHNSVRRGAVDELQKLFQEHPFLKEKLDAPLFAFGSPAIRVAVEQKNRPLIDFLLGAGANINQRSKWDPGSFGVLDNVDEELGQYLMEKGARLDVHSAAGLGKEAELRRFLDNDPSLVNKRGGDGGTPLHFAKNLAIAELLLQRGADVAIRDLDHGSTAAMWQVQNKAVLYRLIQAGSPVDIFMACVHGDLELAQRALKEDPDCPNSVIGSGKFAHDTGGNIYNWKIGFSGRPLAIAASHKHAQLVALLARDSEPKDIFIQACGSGDLALAKATLNDHPDLFKTLTQQDLRAFPDAVWFANIKAVDAFLSFGFPTTGRGQDNGTPLHLAAWTGQPDLVREFIRRGADVEDTGDIHGSPPLGWACHGQLHCGIKGRDYIAVVKALLEAGANPGASANKYGETLLDWATPEIAAELKRPRGARP